MSNRIHHRQAGFGEHALELRGGLLLAVALLARFLEVLHRGKGTRDEHGRQGRREDETRSIGADAVDNPGIGGDVASHHAKRLAQRTFDNGYALCRLVSVGNAAAFLAVHADRVNLIDIGQRIVLVGQVADSVDGRDVAVHGVNAFERDQLRKVWIFRSEQFLEMRDIIVAKDPLFAARIADARDHAGVVQLVGKDDAAGQQFRKRRQRRVIGDIARSEQQGRFLVVKVGKLAFQFYMVMRVAADVPRAAGTGADIVQRFLHRLDHLGVLAHREVVVRAPNGDRLRPVVMRETPSVRECPLVPQDVDEHPVASLGMQTLDSLVENLVVIHKRSIPRVSGSRRCI